MLPKVLFEIDEEEVVEGAREFLDGISKLYGAFMVFCAVGGMASAMGDRRATKDFEELKKRYAKIVDEVPNLHADLMARINRALSTIYADD
ncbi:MAG: hypothetical protein ACFFCW_07020 [Candidatus Hodarchaeota archaeon]